jgi:hypothetical protein
MKELAMRRCHWAPGWIAFMSLAAGVHAIGCFPLDFSEDVSGGPSGAGAAGGAPELRCEPSAQSGPDAPCGVFANSAAPPDGDGSKERPLHTLTAAIDEAAKRKPGERRVYACIGVFTGPVVLPGGVDVYGGLDCAREWRSGGRDQRTELRAGPDEIPLTIAGGAGENRVEGVDVVAEPAMQPGGSSIAVMAEGASVDFVRCTLRAADAMRGDSPGNFEPARAGEPGGDGGMACSASVVPGGEPQSVMCGEETSIGGLGGQGSSQSGGTGDPGAPSPEGATSGLGGAGQSTGACRVGGDGADGQDGTPGKGGRGDGQISRNGYLGVDGASGTPGRIGQGGGGGGGATGGTGERRCPSGARGGASGGAGGTGGCGGKGGLGGQAGGASIAIISLGSELRFEEVMLVAGQGGDGGDGGPGQPGGDGARGGAGGQVPSEASSLAAACRGGKGGDGGDGGDGGGGTGGHSIAIAHTGKPDPPPEGQGYTVRLGTPGNGGLGFNGLEELNGAAGKKESLLIFDE